LNANAEKKPARAGFFSFQDISQSPYTFRAGFETFDFSLPGLVREKADRNAPVENCGDVAPVLAVNFIQQVMELHQFGVPEEPAGTLRYDIAQNKQPPILYPFFG